MQKYIPSTEKIEVLNYPYGFKLRTTLFDYIEYDKKKGYRHCTQTVCPKTNRLNKPKKSTYYPLLLRYYNEAGHIKTAGFDFNGGEAINKGSKFIFENFTLFSPEEIKYLYELILRASIVDMKASCIYGGCKPEDIKQYYSELWIMATNGVKNPEVNDFGLLYIDNEGIDSHKPVNYNPFGVTEYSTL
jgi:hypothetical protein